MGKLGGHHSILFRDIYLFPHFHRTINFKTLNFEKYNGHGDSISNLKRYCNKLRGTEGKEELLMAYFRENLVEITSKWFID